MLGKISIAVSGRKAQHVRLKRVGPRQVALLYALDPIIPKNETLLARELKIERKQVARMLQGLVGRGYASFKSDGFYFLTTMGQAFRKSQEDQP